MSRVFIIGVRGVPNRYGGFERLVEVLAPYLAARGHEVTVFCEKDSSDPEHDLWHGVKRHFIRAEGSGPMRTLRYDWRSFGAASRGAVALIFGYGTGVFQCRLRLNGIRHAVNMDGIEWQRSKWGTWAKRWLRLNERAAIAQADLLIADHPEIERDLQRRHGARSTMIAYGVDLHEGEDTALPDHPLLAKWPEGGFDLVIARPEPENQIHILLEAYAQSARTKPLVLVGNFEANDYGRRLKELHPQAHFVGAVYEPRVVDALRRRSRLYLHGHSVGGTNPSLIEAMAAGALVIAHDNAFNRWVLGDGGLFFRGQTDLSAILDLPPDINVRGRYLAAARAGCRERFLWADILRAYERVVDTLVDMS